MELSLRDALDIFRRPDRRNLTDHAHAGPKRNSSLARARGAKVRWAGRRPSRFGPQKTVSRLRFLVGEPRRNLRGQGA